MNNVMYYVKKPVVVEAIKFTRDNIYEVLEFVNSIKVKLDTNGLVIQTLEGPVFANIGDFIIKGIKDEFYPCKPDIFEMTYRRV